MVDVNAHLRVQDMVESVTRARILYASWPWLRPYDEGNYFDDGMVAPYFYWHYSPSHWGSALPARHVDYCYPAGWKYEEWQLLGTDEEYDGEGSGGSQRSGEEIRAMLVAEPNHDDSEDPRRRFVSFLCNDDITNRVVWLNRTVFVMCFGPLSFKRDAVDMGNTLPMFLSRNHIHGYFDISMATANKRRYELVLFNMDRRRRFGEYTGDDGCSVTLLRLLANASQVTTLEFDSSGLPRDGLRAVVSPAPPPCGRTIDCRCRVWPLNMEMARTLAVDIHRNAELVIHLNDWVRSGSPRSGHHVLAEAMRTNKCPRRLVFDCTEVSPDRRDGVAVLADALRATTAVDAVTIRLASRDGRYDCSTMLLQAVGANTGIRSLVVKEREIMTSIRLMDMWDHVLVSRTIESIDVRVDRTRRRNRYGDPKRRECALRVVTWMRSNKVLTYLLYDTETCDANIMEHQVMPSLELNRVRSMVGSLSLTTLTILVGSDRVRRRSCLLMHVIKAYREVFASSSHSQFAA